jgi:fumarate reductase subunit C
MDGWWRRDPFFVRYMIREATAVFVAVYALVLLFGLVRLSQGEIAYEAWLEALRSPLSIGFHVILLVAFVYHTWSWFDIMPKTMPMIFVGGKRIQPATITNAGLVVAAACCALFLLIVLWIAR